MSATFLWLRVFERRLLFLMSHSLLPAEASLGSLESLQAVIEAAIERREARIHK
jgi:hypothetical protein